MAQITIWLPSELVVELRAKVQRELGVRRHPINRKNMAVTDKLRELIEAYVAPSSDVATGGK